MLGRRLEVRVVADDERIFSAELEADFREDAARAHPLLNQLARRRRAGEADEPDARILDERRAHFRSESLDRRVQPVRQPRVAQQPSERDGGVRRELV